MDIGCRGSGKTYIGGVASLATAAVLGRDVVITSFTNRQVSFVFAEIERILHSMIPFFSEVKDSVHLSDEYHLIRFKSGVQIIGADCECIKEVADSFKVDPALLVVDEGTKIPDYQLGQIRSMADQMGVESSYYAGTSWFQETTWCELYSRFSLGTPEGSAAKTTTVYDMPKDYLDTGIVEKMQKEMHPVKFAMENLGYWPPLSLKAILRM